MLGIVGAAIVMTGPSNEQTSRWSRWAGRLTTSCRRGSTARHTDFDFEKVVLKGPWTNVDDQLAAVAASGSDLVLVGASVFYESALKISKDPDTTWAYLVDFPIVGAPTVTFDVHEAAFLAGAAAALTTKTGKVGYVGGMQIDATEQFHTGCGAGVHEIDPSIEILAEYISLDGSGFSRDSADLVHDTATRIYQRGADVVMHAAGEAGLGLFSAAKEQSDSRSVVSSGRSEPTPISSSTFRRRSTHTC